jgi:solute carrier family 25 (mitochondrial iron transporter), member 28/37
MEEKLLDWEDNVEHLSFYKHMIAGSCAGLVEHSIAFPFDTLRTFAQAETTHVVSISETMQLVRNVGFRSMWKGVTTVLYGCVPAHAAYFSVYELSRKNFQIQSNSNFYLFSTAATGVLATFSHDCLMTPMDGKCYLVVKQRIQLDRTLTPMQMLRHILKTEGAIGLYRSLPITMLMNVPQAALFMTFYENLKSVLFRDGKISIAGYFSCAGVAGALSAGITTPMDVVKTRMQTQGLVSSVFSKECKETNCRPVQADKCPSPRYCSVIGTAKLIWKENGALAFYRGLVPRMMMFLPGAAVSWSVYEHVKTLLAAS